MVISKTPMRISLAGGGTDFPEYFRRRPGHVVSMAIQQYMYVTVNKRFDDTIRVSYSQTEIVKRVADLKHDIIREALRMKGIKGGIEITTIADVPAGTGLGSSSSLAVGVLRALQAYLGAQYTPGQLARDACELELVKLRLPMGIQDAYIAALGGFRSLRFRPEMSVDEVIPAGPLCLPSLLLFYTGVSRESHTILREVKAKMYRVASIGVLDDLKALADTTFESLRVGESRNLGELLHDGWMLKQQMASNVTNPTLDRVYAGALKAGASGGKICGAGGGGCLLLYAPRTRHASIRSFARREGLREIPVALDTEGSRIVYAS